ncbi:MAG: SCO family protein [Alphaproteobacteria bacterium]|nr:SCO family protein [Alphaproteobacteria bacterium]
MTGASPSPAMFQRRWAWGLFTVLILGLPALGVWWRTPPDLPRHAPMPGFDLVDQSGTPLATSELRGDVVLVDFIFTRCPDVCPLLTAQADRLEQGLPDRPLLGVPIRLVSITVDPAYDTPAVLAEYAAVRGLDLSRWQFLTGDPTTVQQVIAGFQTMADRLGDGPEGIPNIAHSERFLLVDAQGVIRGYYRSDEEGLREVARDAHRLARSGGS